MLRFRSRRKRAAVILIYIVVAKFSEIVFLTESAWFSIKITSGLYATVTPYVPGHIFSLIGVASVDAMMLLWCVFFSSLQQHSKDFLAHHAHRIKLACAF